MSKVEGPILLDRIGGRDPGDGPYVPPWEREENLVLMVTKPDRPTRSGEGKRPLSGTSTLLCNPTKGEGEGPHSEKRRKIKEEERRATTKTDEG